MDDFQLEGDELRDALDKIANKSAIGRKQVNFTR
jgi:hypothetical protein